MKRIQLRPVSRRNFLRSAASAAIAGPLLRQGLLAQQGSPRFPDNVRELETEEAALVYGIWRYVGSIYYFDPIGVHIHPGETVGFVIGGTSSRTPTITAYHPANNNHELRIPEAAAAFDSGELVPNRREPCFRLTLSVEGTYDFFSKYNEWVGMIGRIVVGQPGGPGEKPWGYGNRTGSKPIPPAVMKRTSLLDSQRIVREKSIPFPHEKFHTPYPIW